MSKHRSKKPHPSPWQRRVLADLRAAAKERPDVLTSLGQWTMTDSGAVELTVTLNTGLLGQPASKGLPVLKQEQFTVVVGSSEVSPPSVYVDHIRFLRYPHVLQGHMLCLYLDPAREWDPEDGGTGFLNRLWRWLDDAVAGRFDSRNALYHAVGGVLHATKDGSTLVVRDNLPTDRRASTAYLTDRTEHRVDVRLNRQPDENALIAPIFRLRHDLPLGAGSDQLTSLLKRIDLAERLDTGEGTPFHKAVAGTPAVVWVATRRPTLAADAIMSQRHGCQETARTGTRCWDYQPVVNPPPRVSTALLTALAAASTRNPPGSLQRLILAVPHPAGGPDHLLGLTLPATTGDALRKLVRTRSTVLITIVSGRVDSTVAMGWEHLSDERPEVTRRRDAATPMNAYLNRTIHIWGCGGLGSWIAEFVTRAGAKEVVLCDPGSITGGLLARQDFVESDVGDSKVDALARRLHAISDDVDVVIADASVPNDLADLTTDADILIDATISHAITRVLDVITLLPTRTAAIAQVATDARTGTLGIANICAPGMNDGIKRLDDDAAKQVQADATLESYETFWTEPLPGDEFVPTRGCSVPTFHGSAADMAGVAAALAAFIGQSLRAGTSGTHLFALPQSGVTPAHRFLHYGAAEPEATAQ